MPGAALLRDHEANLFVEDLREHIAPMEAFHRRWMPSTAALRGWVTRLHTLESKQICPPHGSIFRGAAVTQLLDWLESLEGCSGRRRMSARAPSRLIPIGAGAAFPATLRA
jgi:flavorubredoxin